ncbi:MAG: hypothetical protein ACSHXD_13395 [Marinosulfonomonas sp.]
MELCLHLGVHRTGTTAFQKACRDQADSLAKDGVAVWPPKAMRTPHRSTFVDLVHRSEIEPEAARLVDQTVWSVRDEMADLKAQGYRRLLVSEENMIGPMDLNFRTRTLYPKVRRRLLAYAQLFQVAPKTVFITIRDYASYWASSFSFVSLRKPLQPFENMKFDIVNEPRGWCDVIADVSASFPMSQIVVGSYSKTPQDALVWAKAMLGIPVDHSFSLPDRPANAAFSAAGLAKAAELSALDPNLTVPELRQAVRDLNPPGAAPFQPFTARELGAFSSRYDADIMEIRSGNLGDVSLFLSDMTKAGSK